MGEGVSCECFIGLWHNYEGSELVSYDDIVRRLADEQEMYEFAQTDPLYKQIHKPWPYSLNDYLDKRKSVNMTRFNFCPVCGNKIDWKAMREGARA